MNNDRPTKSIGGAGRCGRGAKTPRGRGPGNPEGIPQLQAVLSPPLSTAEIQYANTDEDDNHMPDKGKKADEEETPSSPEKAPELENSSGPEKTPKPEKTPEPEEHKVSPLREATPETNFTLSGLPDSVSKDEIEAYFDGQIDDTAKIVSIVLLRGGKAKVVISGLTEEVVKKLQAKKHKIKKQLISLEFDSQQFTCSELQGPTKITVTGFPDAVDEYLLEMYFEGPRSGGQKRAIEQCSIVTSGVAHITFKTPEVASRVISKSGSHILQESSLHVRYYDENEPLEGYESNRLRLHNLPPGTGQDLVQLYLESTLQMEHPQDFSCEVVGQSAVIIFSQDYSGKELSEMIAKLKNKQLKGACIEAELCRVTSSIRVSNITEHYEEDYFGTYFANAKSGGGEVTFVELLGNGEAVVTFKEPKVPNTVLKKSHNTFGRDVVVRREQPLEVRLQTASIPPLIIEVDPLIAESLKKAPKRLESCVQNLHVVITIDASTGTIQVVSTKRTIANWQKECEKCLTTYISSKYTRKERKVPKEAGFDIKNSLPKEAPISISFNQDGTLLTTAGECDTMDIFYHKVEVICSAHEQTNEKQTLTPEGYCYFTVMKQAQVAAVHPEVKIKMNSEDCTITLQGSVQNVKRLKHLLPKYVAHTSVLVQLKDPVIVQYLSTEDGKQHLLKFLQVEKCQVAVHFKQAPFTQPSLHFLCDGSQADSTRHYAESLQQRTSVNSFSLPDTFVLEKDYDDLCRNLGKQFQIQVVTVEEQVSVAGFEPDVTKCTQTIKEFIQEKCMATKTIAIDEGKWRLFCSAMNKTWKSALGQVEQENVKVIAPTDENAAKPQIVLRGDRIQVEKASYSITDLLNSVATSLFPLSHPGTCKFFRGSKSDILIRGIEANEKVVIEVKEIDDTMPDVTADTTSSSQPIKVCVARTAEAKEILLYVGDITEFTRADVLVNAANGQLQHVGGVAKAIADKGGPVIQQESSYYVREAGPLSDGAIFFTTKIGNLPYKALIHAVGPHWNGGSSKEETLLHKACYRSLQKAQQYNSIAIPAIGAGVFGFPIDRCANALIGAAVEFSTNNPGAPMQEIYFVFQHHNDVDTFVAALKKHISPQHVFVTKQRVPPPVTHLQPMVFTVPSKKPTPLRINLHHGSLLDVQADVYINSTNSSLDLSQGAVAQALAKAAGPALQAECNKKAPIQTGGIAVTGAGNLPCRYVFHVIAPNYDRPGGQAEKVLRNIVQKCLKKGTKKGVTSIAFPALGAGNLHFPSSVVAKIMVREILKFLSSKSTTLTAVHLVIFMKDTHQAFQKELSPSSTSDDAVDTTCPSQPTTVGNTFTTPLMPSGASPQTPPFGVQWFPFGDITVMIDHGDIADDNSDAVVNSTNSNLRLKGGGVSSALLKKGGPELQAECDKITSRDVRLDEGSVIQTPATGTLKCKSVFHTKFESQDPKIFLKTVHTCLQKAEDLQYQSIAFPAIGTGDNGYPSQDAAKGMLQAIQQFASSKHVHLATIHIVLFQQSIYQTFLSTFQDASQPGLFQSAKTWMGSLWQASCPDDSEGITVDKLVQDEIIYKELEVRIYGENITHVQKAEEMLHKLFVAEIMEDQYVANLSQGQKCELNRKSQGLQVEIEIHLNCINLRGYKEDVDQMKFEILQTLGKTREAEHLHKIVQWKCQDFQGTWKEYDAMVNFEIEQAFKARKMTYNHDDRANSEWFTIDFKKLEETDHISQYTYKVQRFDLYREGSPRPSHWVPMPVDPATKIEVSVHTVDLDPGSSEYKDVLKTLNKTMTPVRHYRTIVKIERIQNPTLYGQYIARKKEMDKQNPQGHQNERQLFHGTSTDTVPKVNQQGFNRSFAGRNATVYGRGVYFARDASYSARGTYSRPDSSGQKYVYLARALTGEFTRGDSSMIVPPAKNPQKDQHLLFDSVVDNPSNPGIFVIFSDSQAYPEYLITFN